MDGTLFQYYGTTFHQRRIPDDTLDRDVAVKFLSDRYPADSAAAQRFAHEARITGQLQHPGIPAVHLVGALPDARQSSNAPVWSSPAMSDRSQRTRGCAACCMSSRCSS